MPDAQTPTWYHPAPAERARLLLAQGDADRALEVLRRLAALAECQHRTGSLMQIRALRARGLQAAGDHEAALAELADALALAAPEGYVRVFLDEGASMAALLDGLAAATGKGGPPAGVPPAYLGRLLRALQQANLPVGRHGRRVAEVVPGLPDPLSARELEVLALLAAGRSNQAIARELVITVDTVKRHVSHILDKLGAANRTQAVARARELGVPRIPP
jgi:LuxR family maltose regulon positive regulatory protein